MASSMVSDSWHGWMGQSVLQDYSPLFFTHTTHFYYMQILTSLSLSHSLIHSLIPPPPCRLMGNLARAAFPASTKAVWPWSYDTCDHSIPHLANRQEINACDASPGHGLNPHQGRGSPEIDLFEVNSVPYRGKKVSDKDKKKHEDKAISDTTPAFMRYAASGHISTKYAILPV